MTGAERPGFIAFPSIDAYGDLGFRVAGARVEGSILIVNGALLAWPPAALDAVEPDHLAPALTAEPRPELILLGVGPTMARPPEAVRDAVRAAGVALEFMATSAACRVYATLIGEGRHIAAALIAVE